MTKKRPILRINENFEERMVGGSDKKLKEKDSKSLSAQDFVDEKNCNPYHRNENDKEAISELAEEKSKLLNKVSEIDNQIVSIQRSTRTSIKVLAPIHNSLRMRFKWYYNWHLNRYANLIHYIVLVIYFLLVSGTFIFASNAGWNLARLFQPENTAMAATVNISGTCKQFDQTTACAGTSAVKVAVNGTISAVTANLSTGSFTLSNVTVNANDVVTVFLDEVADANEAVAVAKIAATPASLTGITLFERHLTLGSATTSTVTNTDVSQYDNSVSADEDIFHEVDASDNLLIPATSTQTSTDQKLYIVATTTFRPNSSGGKIVTTPNFHLPASSVVSCDSNTFNIMASGTPFVRAGTFTVGTGTFNYLGTGATNVTATTYRNLGVGVVADTGTAVSYTLAGTTTVSGVLTVGNAGSTNSDILNGSSRTVNLTGAGTPFVVTSKGSFTYGTSTINYNGTTATNVAGGITYYNLGVGTTANANATTYTLAGDIAVTNLITIGQGTTNALDTFALSNKTVTVTRATSSPFTVNTYGRFQADTSTVAYTLGSNVMSVAALTYCNLNITPTLTAARAYTTAGVVTVGGNFILNPTASAAYELSFTLGGNFTVTGSSTITKTTNATSVFNTNGTSNYAFSTGSLVTQTGGTVTLNTSQVTLSGSGTVVTNNGTLNYSAASFIYTGSSATSVAALNYKNLTINHAGVTFTAAGDMTIPGVFTITAGTFDASSRIITLSGTGTPFVNSGTLTSSTSTFKYTGVGAVTVASTTYNILETKPSAALTGWTVTNPDTIGDSAYAGTYIASGGIHNGQPTYTNGTKWLYLNRDDMCPEGCFNWALYTSVADLMDVGFTAAYYNNGSVMPGTWYENWMAPNGPVPTFQAYSATPAYTFSTGTLDVSANYVNGDATNAVSTNAATNDPIVRVDGNFTNSASATFTFSDSANTYVSGNYTNSATGVVVTTGSLIIFDGTALQTITAGGTSTDQDYVNISITNASDGGVKFADSIKMAGLTATTASTLITVQAGATITLVNISLDGQSTGTRVALRSSLTNSPWYLVSSDSTPTILNTDVKDSDASGGMGVEALISNGNLDSGGSTNWSFDAATPRNISGTLYTADLSNSTPVANKTLGLSVNGGTVSTVDTDSSGNYTFSNIPIRDDSIFVIFIKAETEKGTYILKTGTVTADITGASLNVGHVKIVGINDSTAVTNSMLDTADSSGDSDLEFSVANGTATFEQRLHVGNDRLYQPGGNLVVDDIHIKGSLNIENNSITVHGSWQNDVGTFTAGGSSAVTFDSSSTGETIATDGDAFDHVIFNNATGGWSFSSATTLNGDLTVTAGTLSGASNITINGGDVSGNGTISLTGGTFLVDGVGNLGGNTNWTFSGLTFGDGTGTATTTKTGSGNITSSGVLTIAANQTLNVGDDTWTLSGSGAPFVISGTFQEGSSTFIYTGSSATNVAGTTYYALKVNQAGTTFTSAGATEVKNVFTLQAGTFDASNSTIVLSGAGTPLVVSGTLDGSTSTIKYTGAGVTTLTASNYYNLEAIPASQSSGWSITGASDSSYNGTYTESGTMNGQPKYTNGSRWLFYNWSDMMGTYHWGMYSSASNCWEPSMCLAYYQWPDASLPGSWYASEGYSGSLVFDALTAYNYTLSAGTFNISGNYTNGSQSVAVSTNADINDPIFNVDGNFLNETGSTFTASASAAFSLASSFTNNGSFIDSGGLLTLDGQGLQTITAGGTDAAHNFNNLTVINASTSGVSFADSASVSGIFTAVTPSTVLTFHAGSTYAFANININGQAIGTRIVMKSSTNASAWLFNVAQSDPSVSYVNVRDSNASGGNGISAVVGSLDGTGNTNWTFAGTEITISGTVYTAENKSTNIGADKTVALSINGAAATTVETTSGGAFNFTGVVLVVNNPVAVFISGETEKGSLITQAATATNDITGLELFTEHVVLTHDSSSPMSNTLLATADNVADTDLLVSVSGSDATFTTGNEVWIIGGKTFTPGGNVTCGSLEILTTGVFAPEANNLTLNDSGTPFTATGTFTEGASTVTYAGTQATTIAGSTYKNLKVNQTGTTFTAGGSMTVSGVFTIQAGTFDASDKTITLSGTGTPFVKTGTLTASTSTFKYTGAEATTVAAADYYHLETVPASAPSGGGGWILGGTLSDSSYSGTYTASGTMNGQPKYTNGSRWLYYNHYDMPGPGENWALSSSASDCFDPYMCTAYYQSPGDTSPSTPTWYASMDFTGTPTFDETASSYVYTFASGTINIGGNYTNGTASVTVETNATTNDPVINIDGNFSNLAGSTFIASNSASFGVASNFTNSATGKFTDSGGTLTLDGQGLQTITAGGTSADFDFTNLTITNASTAGVEFVDSVTVTGVFTDVTASSKVTFHSGSTYAFNAISINGQATGTRITLTSSSSGTPWNLNITASSPTASNVSVKDSNANKDIDASTGGYDVTGNTHWLFPVTVYLSGTVYTAENKSTNIGANKTVALSINGGTKITDETDSSGIFRFDDITIGTNNPVTVFISGETEKGSLVTIAANTAAITSLELFTSRVVLTHHSADPMSNTVLATADNACTSDCLFSVDGSSVATFTSGNEVFIPTSKTYTPGAAIIADDIESDGTLTLAGNAATVHGSWDSADGFFSSSGTVTFDAASGTEILNTGGAGGDGGWEVIGADDTSYNGTYTPSGTHNGKPTYSNGSRWMFYNKDDMGWPEPTYYWLMYSSVGDMMDGSMMAAYYFYGETLPGTWYPGMSYTGNVSLSPIAANGGSFTNLTKSGDGTLQLADDVDIDGTLNVGSATTFDINGKNFALATLSNDGTLKLQGGETATITTFDSNSGTVEYSGTSTYTSLLLGDAYSGLKINGSGGSWTLDANLAVSSVLDINAGTLNASSKTVTLSGSGTPFIVTGTFTESGSTVLYTGGSATNVAGTTYNNLTLNKSGTTFTAGGDLMTRGVLTIQAGEFDASSRTITISGGGTPFVNNGTFTASASNVLYNSNSVINVLSSTYNNLSFSNDNAALKREISIANSTGSTLTNHQVKISLTSSNFSFANSTLDGRDLRFKDSSESSNLSYYIESWNQSEQTGTIWVKVPSIPTAGATIYLYYGDDTLAAGSSGSNTFDFFDDFNDGDYTSGSSWTATAGTWEVSGGSLQTSSTGHNILYNTDYTGTDYVTEAKIRITTAISGDQQAWLVSRYAEGNYYGYGYRGYNGSNQWELWRSTAATLDSHAPQTMTQNVWYKNKLQVAGSNIKGKSWAFGQAEPSTWGVEATDASFSSGGVGIKGSWAAATVQADDIFVRKYASTEPATTVGSEVNADGVWTFAGNTTVNNNVVIASGTVKGSSRSLDIKGDWTNAGTFTAETSTITFSGTTAQSITSGGSDFNNLTVTNASTAGVSFADSATVSGTFTDVTPSSKATFLSGGTYTFNSININGQATGTRVTLVSSASGTPWNLNVTEASPTASNVFVKDSNANKDIDATTGGFDGTGNTHWLFPVTGATISGTIYTLEDKNANIGADKTVALSINGATATTVESTSGGVFSFSDVTVAANNTIALFIDGETEKGSYITQASGAEDITGIELFTSHIVLTHATTGPMTNTLLDTADNVSDSDLLVSVSTGNATFTAGNEVWIIAGKSYTPGGAVSADDVNVAGTLTMETNFLTVSGSFTNSGTFTTTGALLFNSTAASKNITSGSANLGAVTFNGIGGEWTLQDNLTATSITMTSGRLYDNAKTVTVNGSIMLADVANLLTSTGSWIMAGSGSINNFVTDPYYVSNIFKNLTIKTGVTVDVDDYLNVKKLTVEDSSTITGRWVHIYPEASNYFTQGSNVNMATSTIKVLKNIGDQNITLEQGKIDAPNTSVSLAYGTGVIHKMTDSWTVLNLIVEGGFSDNTQEEATTLDTNGYNLTVNGKLTYGETRVGAANGFHAKILFGTGTHTIAGDLKANITGATDTHGYLYFGSSNISVGGSIDLSKTTVDAGTGTVHLNGSAAQAITSSLNSFSNLTITNASTAGVAFVDSATLTGTFTDVTPSSKITFNSGSTYAFNAININGQATGTRVTFTSSSAGTAWNLNIAAISPTASNVSVKDSNANKDIDATTGGEDLTGNTHWLFPSGNVAPVNDSLTFTNPYSSNVAIADNTTEWNFGALVTDSDGVANLNYVELRLANSADSAQPYDSINLRWTQSTNTFSEEADTQDAITLTGTSSGDANQKTINFNVKIDNDFLTKNTNYAAELYLIDDLNATDTDNYANIYQVQGLSITLGVDEGDLVLGSLLPGSVLTGTTLATVTTNFPNGYTLSAHDSVAASSSVLLHTDNSTRIADYAGTVNEPSLWSNTGFGICLFAATNKESKWGTGTTASDENNKYAGIPQNAAIIHTKTGAFASSDINSIGYKLVVPNTQKSGTYLGVITYTATGVLN